MKKHWTDDSDEKCRHGVLMTEICEKCEEIKQALEKLKGEKQ